MDGREARAQTPTLAFDPPFGACEDAELTVRGEGFPAGARVALFGGAAEGPALDRFALTIVKPEVAADGSFEVMLDGLPILCATESVGIFAMVEDESGSTVSQTRAIYFVAIQPPASGDGVALVAEPQSPAVGSSLGPLALMATLGGAALARRWIRVAR